MTTDKHEEIWSQPLAYAHIKSLTLRDLLHLREFIELRINAQHRANYREPMEELLCKMFGGNVILPNQTDFTGAFQIVDEVLATLTPREEKVIKMRFGFEDRKKRNQSEIGSYFAVTQPQISRIEAKALRRLRHPSRSRRLMAFPEGKQ